jgi:hypothetical protein
MLTVSSGQSSVSPDVERRLRFDSDGVAQSNIRRPEGSGRLQVLRICRAASNDQSNNSRRLNC